MYKRIVVKIGSGVVTKNGKLDQRIIGHIVSQVAATRKRGIEMILVTSGAVAAGRGMVALKGRTDEIVEKQIFAAVGQVELMSIYQSLFKRRGYNTAQVLVTKEDFRDRQHYFNMKQCVSNLIRDDIIPIVNENDVIAITELIFTDNDELAGLLASALGADGVLVLTGVDGVLDGDPSDPESRVIRKIDPSESISHERHITSRRSASGRGGMYTKFNIAKKLASQGITTHIINGTKPNIITNVLNGKNVGTRFIPERKLSGMKRRLAYSEGLSKGAVYVKDDAVEILRSAKSVSLLPVGIVRVEGQFQKGDVIEIRNKKKKKVGYGIAQYSADVARESAGKKGVRALIHYDYMFIG